MFLCVTVITVKGETMGKGGGKGHTPVEAKDNLKSTQMMSVIDAIGGLRQRIISNPRR